MSEITELLERARNGEPEQLDRVFGALYAELRRLAEARLASGNQTLTPTVLVHEVFLTLRGNESLSLNDRRHFFACAARSMRC
ncbi:MAG: ECF-type sigma factor, partial [Rhodanobacteraceae bacterium]